MNIRYLIVSLVLVGFTTAYNINEKEVERILTTLSSDEMQGRSLGSEGLEKSASFIANEFKAIGLSTLESEESFRQNFNMNSISVEVDQVVINNLVLASSNYFFKISAEKIAWSNENLPTVEYIKSDDNFREKAGNAMSSSTDLLVIVSESHKEMFGRYQSYFSKPTMSFDKSTGNGPNVGFLLIDTERIEDVSIKLANVIDTTQLTNLVGVIEGKRSNEILLYSAHYDHLGTKNNAQGDSIYNGANDDASGVTAVIELARYFKSKGKPERTLMFVAFTAEEVGGYGSKYFSKQMNPDEIVAMFNIEMIGKESKEGLNSAWMTGWDKSNLGEILQENLGKVDFKFFQDPYPKQNLFYRSDNATLARLGVPAHSISTTQIDIDKDYHQLSDEVETLDITNITNTIKAIAVGSQGIIDGTQTPTRVDPSDVKN
ncbi:MAG: M20/M25/M40 family metallo-hydrolase [Cyclobacteriaceae bacterium]|nr:M20/M25/M40 family metallo-hydrolase [Cyclobacteriaceae bacterium]